MGVVRPAVDIVAELGLGAPKGAGEPLRGTAAYQSLGPPVLW